MFACSLRDGRSGFFFFSSFSFSFFFILPSIVDYLDPGYNGTSYGNLCSCTGTLSARMHFSRIKFIFVAMFTRRHVGMEKKKKKRREMIKVPLKRGTVTVDIIVLKIDVEK